MGLHSFFPFGRDRPSIRAFLGDLTGKFMSVEASLVRIEQQNALISEVLTGVFKTQNTHSDMLKTLAAAAPEAIDTTALDASIAATDAVLAKLAPVSASGATAGAVAGTAAGPATDTSNGSAAQQPDPATESAAAGAKPAAQPAQPADAPAGATTAV